MVGTRLNEWRNFGVSYHRVPNLIPIKKKSLHACHQALRLSTGEKYILALRLSDKTAIQGL